MSYYYKAEKEVEEGIKEGLKEILVPYERCRELVFLIASNNNPTIKEVGKYLEDAEEIRSYFGDYFERKEQI